MFGLLNALFSNKCEHTNIKKIEHTINEIKCDCCNKVLYLKEDKDYVVESTKIK